MFTLHTEPLHTEYGMLYMWCLLWIFQKNCGKINFFAFTHYSQISEFALVFHLATFGLHFYSAPNLWGSSANLYLLWCNMNADNFVIIYSLYIFCDSCVIIYSTYSLHIFYQHSLHVIYVIQLQVLILITSVKPMNMHSFQSWWSYNLRKPILLL